MSELPDRTTLNPAAPPGMAELSGGGRVVGIVAAQGAHQNGSAAEAAAQMAEAWSAGGIRLILADGSLAEPKLHDELGIENGEGISDALVFGSSLRRVALKVEGRDYFAVAAGTVVADPSQAMAAGRWSLLCEGFRSAGVMLAVYLNAEDPSTAIALREATHVVVVAEGTEAVPAVVAEGRAPVLAVIGVEAPEPSPQLAGGGDGVEAPEAAVEEEFDFGGLADEISGAGSGAAAEEDFHFDGLADEGTAASEAAPEEEEFDFGGLADEIGAGGSGASDEEDFDFGGVTDEVPAIVDEPGDETGGLDFGGLADQIAAADAAPGVDGEGLDSEGLADPMPAPDPAPPVEEPSLYAGGGSQEGGFDRGRTSRPAGFVSGSGVQDDAPEVPATIGGVGGGSFPPPSPAQPLAGGEGAPAQRGPAAPGQGGEGGKQEITLLRYSPDELPGGRKRKKEPPSLARQLLTLVVLLATVLAGDWYGFLQVPGLNFGPAAEPVQSGPSGDGAPASGELVEQAPAQAYSVALAAYGDASAARDLVDRARADLPDVLFLVVPVEVNGQTFHRALAGPAVDEAAASALLDRIASSTGMSSAGWVIRNTARAFQLEETAELGAARQRVDSLTAMGVPAYVLATDYSDGSQRYRVYAGAYADEAEASTLAAYLTDNGVDAGSLVERKGRLPE